MIKNPPANAGGARDVGSVPGLGRSSREGNGNPLQYSCLGNPWRDGPGWYNPWESPKSWTWLSD